MKPADPTVFAARRSPFAYRPSPGFTLIELMLAVAIAVVLLGLVFSLYHALSRTVEDQHERREGGTAMMYALDRLTRDLMSALPVSGFEEGGFRLETEAASRGPSSRIVFSTTRARPAYTEPGNGLAENAVGSGEESDLRWFEIVEVAYWLDYAPRQRGRLLRTERPLVGPEALEPARTNVLATGVNVFHVRVRGDQEWEDAWDVDPEDEDAEWPRAARITLEPDGRAKGARARTVDVLIPTGWTIERE